jgi:hypothetical protein
MSGSAPDTSNIEIQGDASAGTSWLWKPSPTCGTTGVKSSRSSAARITYRSRAGFFAVYNKGGDYASPRCSRLSPGWRR